MVVKLKDPTVFTPKQYEERIQPYQQTYDAALNRYTPLETSFNQVEQETKRIFTDHDKRVDEINRLNAEYDVLKNELEPFVDKAASTDKETVYKVGTPDNLFNQLKKKGTEATNAYTNYLFWKNNVKYDDNLKRYNEIAGQTRDAGESLNEAADALNKESRKLSNQAVILDSPVYVPGSIELQQSIADPFGIKTYAALAIAKQHLTDKLYDVFTPYPTQAVTRPTVKQEDLTQEFLDQEYSAGVDTTSPSIADRERSAAAIVDELGPAGSQQSLTIEELDAAVEAGIRTRETIEARQKQAEEELVQLHSRFDPAQQPETEVSREFDRLREQSPSVQPFDAVLFGNIDRAFKDQGLEDISTTVAQDISTQYQESGLSPQEFLGENNANLNKLIDESVEKNLDTSLTAALKGIPGQFKEGAQLFGEFFGSSRPAQAIAEGVKDPAAVGEAVEYLATNPTIHRTLLSLVPLYDLVTEWNNSSNTEKGFYAAMDLVTVIPVLASSKAVRGALKTAARSVRTDLGPIFGSQRYTSPQTPVSYTHLRARDS